MSMMTRRDNKTVVEEVSHAELTRLIKEHADKEKEQEAKSTAK